MIPIAIIPAIEAAFKLFEMIKDQGGPAVKAALKFVQKPNPSNADVDAAFDEIKNLSFWDAKAAAVKRIEAESAAAAATPKTHP